MAGNMSMINLAATPTAITAGSLPASSGSPIGEVIMEIAASECPAAARLCRNRDHFDVSSGTCVPGDPDRRPQREIRRTAHEWGCENELLAMSDLAVRRLAVSRDDTIGARLRRLDCRKPQHIDGPWHRVGGNQCQR